MKIGVERQKTYLKEEGLYALDLMLMIHSKLLTMPMAAQAAIQQRISFGKI